VTEDRFGGEPERAIPITAEMLDGCTPDTRTDFERGMKTVPPVTLTLIGALVLIFGWELTSGALQSQSAILAAGALARGPVASGEVWRLITAPFLHAGLGHLLGNCVALYIVGMACEHAMGALRFAAVYVASALAGSGASLLGNAGLSVGASGAIFGILGSVVVVLYRYRARWHLRDRRIGLVLLVWAGFEVTTGWMTPFVDNFAHVGGLVGGVLATLGLTARLQPGSRVAAGSPAGTSAS
jgi:rhomboid protease GluP